MAKYKAQRQSRYQILRDSWFQDFEASEFSVLPRRTPALFAMIADRVARRSRFEKIARRKLSLGLWRPNMVEDKWKLNIRRMYRGRRWIVRRGPEGKQKGPTKGYPSPWAAYRRYEKNVPDKGYISPWEIKQISKGKTAFDRGTLFVQKAQRMGAGEGRQAMLKEWVRQLNASIGMSRGVVRERFVAQRKRLEAMLV